jgi:serine/threonine-protein kinase
MVGQVAPAPWAALFAAAGLDQSRFNETTPGWPPTAFADERRAWTGTFPELAEKPIVIEAAAYQGRPVMFTLTAPWTTPPDRSDSSTTSAEVGGFVSIVVFGLAAFIARRHWKAGRVDRQAATRLAIAFFASDLAIWLIRPHVHSLGSEAARFGAVLGSALLGGAIVFLIYLGLEPIVRRLWPRALVTWSRLVTGQVRDPLVGRDMLVGVVLGLATSALLRVPHYGWLPGRVPSPEQGNLAALSGWTEVIADLGSGVLAASLLAMIAMLALTLVRWLVRRDWVLIAGVAGLVLVGVGVAAVTGRQSWTGWQIVRVIIGLAVIGSVVAGIVTSIIRGGLFLSAVMFYVVGIAAQFPLLLDSRQPAAPASWLTAALILAIAGVGFRLAVRPLAASPYR